MDIVSYILSKKYTDQTVDGLGAIKGAPCTVQSIVDITDGKRVTLAWESNSGVEQTQSFDIMNGEDGDTIEWNQIQRSGTKIAEVVINGSTTNVYAPNGGGGGASALEDLSDVNITNPTDGQVLKYDATNDKWVNATGEGGGSVEIQSTVIYEPTSESSTGSTYTLSDSIDNYDFISIYNGVWNEYISGDKFAEDAFVPVDTFNSLYADGKQYAITSFSSRFLHITLHDTTLTVTNRSSLDICKIVGHKIIGSGGAGSGSLDAVETTSSAYSQLPSADKQDATKIYFLNDTQSGTQDTPIDATTFTNRAESSSCMGLSVTNGKLTYVYKGGAAIGANSYRNIAIPSTVSKIKFKLTTGTSYSTGTNPDWVVCIGVKANQYTDWINPTDSNWLVKKKFDTRNSSYEDYLDLSDISTDCYLMIVAHGWTVTFDEITIEEPLAPTGETKIKYKDIAYGIGSGGSGDGMFVDFDNLITSGTYIASTPLSYTATVDCYILIASVNWGSQRTKIYIDGVEINNLYSTQSFVQTVGYFLKKGQVCTATTDCSQENSGYAVYGLQQGSNVQHNYSTSEQLIGTWIDGKPLYQKTWSNLAITLLSPNTWVSTGIPATEIDTIVDGTMQDNNRQKLGGTIGFTSSDTYIGVCPQIGDREITTLTIQYTKKADT